VEDNIPEISIRVVKAWRGQGVGRAMLDALVHEAVQRCVPAQSLSVEPDDNAVRLYEHVGFRKVADTEGATTMILTLRLPT
jgi:ribosomal protein S18 acetylase RimI-like enzyme